MSTPDPRDPINPISIDPLDPDFTWDAALNIKPLRSPN
jgi:hypothetical protein